MAADCSDGSGSSPRALLELRNARLKILDLLLEIRHHALQDLTPRRLVSEKGLDPTEGRHDRVIFLLQPLEAPVQLIKVRQHVPELLVDGLEPLIQRREPAVQVKDKIHKALVYRHEALVHRVKALIHRVEPLIHCVEALIHRVEVVVDRVEAPAQGLPALTGYRGHPARQDAGEAPVFSSTVGAGAG